MRNTNWYGTHDQRWMMVTVITNAVLGDHTFFHQRCVRYGAIQFWGNLDSRVHQKGVCIFWIHLETGNLRFTLLSGQDMHFASTRLIVYIYNV